MSAFSADIPKPIIIAGLTRKIAKLKNGLEKLHKKRAGLEKDLKAVKSVNKEAVKEFEKRMYEQNDRIQSVTKQLQGMTNKYNKLVEDSGNVVNVVSERDSLNKGIPKAGHESWVVQGPQKSRSKVNPWPFESPANRNIETKKSAKKEIGQQAVRESIWTYCA